MPSITKNKKTKKTTKTTKTQFKTKKIRLLKVSWEMIINY